MHIIERHIAAVNSTNLKCDDTHHQVDVLIAAGMSRGIGSMLWRAKYVDLIKLKKEQPLPSLFAPWIQHVLNVSIKEHWPADIQHCKIADKAIRYWLNDGCRACGSTGLQVHPENEQMRTDNPCVLCAGTGRRKIRSDDLAKKQMELVEDMVNEINTEVSLHAQKIMRKLAKQMDF